MNGRRKEKEIAAGNFWSIHTSQSSLLIGQKNWVIYIDVCEQSQYIAVYFTTCLNRKPVHHAGLG